MAIAGTFEIGTGRFRIDSWTEFKKLLDGTYARLAYVYQDSGVGNHYLVVTEAWLGRQYQCAVKRDGGADDTDFVNNWKDKNQRGEKDPTYSATVLAVTLAANKSLLSILNASASKVDVMIWEIYLVNAQTSAVTGTATLFEVRRITGHSAGTLVVPQGYDLADPTFDANVTLRTGGTMAGESASPITALRWSSDEWGPGTLDVEAYEHAQQQLVPIDFATRGRQEPLVVRPGEGINVRSTGAGPGSFDVEVVFTTR